MDENGNVVKEEDLKNHFEADGTYTGGLYKKLTAAGTGSNNGKNAGELVEVGADTNEDNKISIDIKSMSADSLGIKNLKVDGANSDNADAAVPVIAEAIQLVY